MFFFSVGSYFALQWLANFLVAAATLGQNCVRSETANTVLHLVSLLASGGLSVIGTNLLCHRYLVEKARVMIKLYGTSTLISHAPSLDLPPETHPESRVSLMSLPSIVFLIAALMMPTIPRSNIWKCWKDPWCGRQGACSLSPWEHLHWLSAGQWD